jgi:hypothetical protein
VNEVDRLLSQLDGLAGSFDFAATWGDCRQSTDQQSYRPFYVTRTSAASG